LKNLCVISHRTGRSLYASINWRTKSSDHSISLKGKNGKYQLSLLVLL
jgi:hypothetical protein